MREADPNAFTVRRPFPSARLGDVVVPHRSFDWFDAIPSGEANVISLSSVEALVHPDGPRVIRGNAYRVLTTDLASVPGFDVKALPYLDSPYSDGDDYCSNVLPLLAPDGIIPRFDEWLCDGYSDSLMPLAIRDVARDRMEAILQRIVRIWIMERIRHAFSNNISALDLLSRSSDHPFVVVDLSRRNVLDDLKLGLSPDDVDIGIRGYPQEQDKALAVRNAWEERFYLGIQYILEEYFPEYYGIATRTRGRIGPVIRLSSEYPSVEDYADCPQIGLILSVDRQQNVPPLSQFDELSLVRLNSTGYQEFWDGHVPTID